MPNSLPTMDPDIKPKQRRAQVEYKGVAMTYSRYERIKELSIFIEQANERRLTIPKAAKWMGYSISTLRNWIRILNINWNKRPKRKVRKFDTSTWEARILAAYKEGKTQTQIACELKVGLWNVSRFIKANGLRRPNNRERLTA